MLPTYTIRQSISYTTSQKPGLKSLQQGFTIKITFEGCIISQSWFYYWTIIYNQHCQCKTQSPPTEKIVFYIVKLISCLVHQQDVIPVQKCQLVGTKRMALYSIYIYYICQAHEDNHMTLKYRQQHTKGNNVTYNR